MQYDADHMSVLILQIQVISTRDLGELDILLFGALDFLLGTIVLLLVCIAFQILFVENSKF